MANLAANDGLSGRRPTSNVGKTGHLAHSGFLIFVAFASLPVSCQFHQLGTLSPPSPLLLVLELRKRSCAVPLIKLGHRLLAHRSGGGQPSASSPANNSF